MDENEMTTIVAGLNKLPKPTNFNALYILAQQAFENGFRAMTVNELVVYLSKNLPDDLTRSEFIAEKFAPGSTLPDPERQASLFLGAGTYNTPGGGPALELTENFNVISWDGEKWVKVLEVPIVVPQAENKIEPWTAKGFNAGSQVLRDGQWWTASIATLAEDIPGISAKWLPAITVVSDALLYGLTLQESNLSVGGINQTTGADMAANKFYRSGYLPTRVGLPIDYKLRGDMFLMFFYGENKNFLSAAVRAGNVGFFNTMEGTIESVPGAYFYRVSVLNPTHGSYLSDSFYIKFKGIINTPSLDLMAWEPEQLYPLGIKRFHKGQLWIALQNTSREPGDTLRPTWMSLGDDNELKIERANANIFNPFHEAGYGKELRAGSVIDNSYYYTTEVMEWGDNIRIARTGLPIVAAQYDEFYRYISGSLVTERRFDKLPTAKYFQLRVPMSEKNSTVVTFVPAGELYASTNEPFSLNIKQTKGGAPVKFGPVRNEFADKIAVLTRAYTRNDANVFNLIHYSDIHYNSQNAANNFREMLEFSKHEMITPFLDAVIFGGDACNGNDRIAKATTLIELNAHMADIVKFEKPTMPAIGNHDDNINTVSANAGGGGGFANALSKEEQYELLIRPLAEKWGFTNYTANKGYFYQDFPEKGIRVITLDCFDLPIVADGTKLKYVGGMYYSQAQIDWFLQALTSTPAGYHVVISNHVTFNEGFTAGAVYLQGRDFIPSVINAFKTGGTYNHDYVNPTFPELNTAKEFTFATAGVFVCYLTGHIHYTQFLEQDAFPDQKTIVTACTKTDNTSFMNRYVDVDEYRNSFAFISINRATRSIFTTTYGAFQPRNGSVMERVVCIPY